MLPVRTSRAPSCWSGTRTRPTSGMPTSARGWSTSSFEHYRSHFAAAAAGRELIKDDGFEVGCSRSAQSLCATRDELSCTCRAVGRIAKSSSMPMPDCERDEAKKKSPPFGETLLVPIRPGSLSRALSPGTCFVLEKGARAEMPFPACPEVRLPR